jgi:lysophospholipase L1-like esterase
LQDQAVRTALEAYPDAIFVDTWSIFDGVNGGIAELVIDPRDGAAKPVRQSDGFHLNEDGAAILAENIADRIETVLADMGADI